MRANTSLGVSRIIVVALLCVGTVGVAHAQVSPSQALLNNTFVGSIGAFVVSTDTKARAPIGRVRSRMEMVEFIEVVRTDFN